MLKTCHLTFQPGPQKLITSVNRSSYEVAERTFHLKGADYNCIITSQQAESFVGWNPSLPLPFTVEKAEEIARKELTKLVHDEFRWQFSELSIARFHRPTPNGDNWYFALTMKPVPLVGEANSDFFTILLSASGHPGIIGGTQRPPKQNPNQMLF